MATYKNATKLAKAWEARTDLLLLSYNDIHKKLVESSKDDFFYFTRGSLKYKDRKRLGWPYARERNVSKRGKVFDSMRGAKDYNLTASGINSGSLAIGSDKTGKVFGRVQRLPINNDTGSLQASITLKEFPDDKEMTYHLFANSVSSRVLSIGGLSNMIDRGFYGNRGIIKKQYKARRLGLRASAQKNNVRHWR